MRRIVLNLSRTSPNHSSQRETQRRLQQNLPDPTAIQILFWHFPRLTRESGECGKTLEAVNLLLIWYMVFLVVVFKALHDIHVIIYNCQFIKLGVALACRHQTLTCPVHSASSFDHFHDNNNARGTFRNRDSD